MGDLIKDFFEWYKDFRDIIWPIYLVVGIVCLIFYFIDKGEGEGEDELDPELVDLETEKKYEHDNKDAEHSTKHDEYAIPHITSNQDVNLEENSLDEVIGLDVIINKFIDAKSSYISSIISIIPFWIGDQCMNGAMQGTAVYEILHGHLSFGDYFAIFFCAIIFSK